MKKKSVIWALTKKGISKNRLFPAHVDTPLGTSQMLAAVFKADI